MTVKKYQKIVLFFSTKKHVEKVVFFHRTRVKKFQKTVSFLLPAEVLKNCRTFYMVLENIIPIFVTLNFYLKTISYYGQQKQYGLLGFRLR